MKLMHHVYLVSGFAYGLHPNMYAVESEDGVILIDTGLDEEDDACAQRVMQTWGLADKPILGVLITHAHFDHAGNAWRYHERGVPIYAGDGDAQGIASGDERTIAYTYSRMFPACPVDHVLTDGDRVTLGGLTFAAIHVPGHSRGSMAYLVRVDGQDVMFTGDFIRVGENCQSAMMGFSGAEDYDPEAYMASLKKIRTFHPDVVLGGHHQPCLTEGWKVLDKAYTYALVNWRWPSVKG